MHFKIVYSSSFHILRHNQVSLTKEFGSIHFAEAMLEDCNTPFLGKINFLRKFQLSFLFVYFYANFNKSPSGTPFKKLIFKETFT